jgi:hypothetical protein
MEIDNRSVVWNDAARGIVVLVSSTSSSSCLAFVAVIIILSSSHTLFHFDVSNDVEKKNETFAERTGAP